MAHVKIVTDSTADIPASLVNDLGITVVPLKVHFGEETYLDGVSIQPDMFYDKLRQAERLPTTSQPSPIDFVNTYQKVTEDSKEMHIISIHLSSALSGTVQSALLAKSMVKDKLSITVVDSKKASYAIGIIVVAVAEAAKRGESVEYCQKLTERLVNDSCVFFLVDTLTFLQKGGRIGKASALLGSLLNIKPILSLNSQGEVHALDKARGKSKALNRIIELLNQFSKGERVRIGISHADSETEAQEIANQLKQSFQVDEIVITEIGPVVGTHVGPGTIAIAMIAE